MTTTIPDYETAAIKAAETLIKFHVDSSPVIPLPILKKMPNVIVISFAEMAEQMNMERKNLLDMFGSYNQDASTSLKTINGKTIYVVTYNQKLPFYLLQRSLATQLGHIVLNHDGSRPEDVRMEEAQCFARHLICPRPVLAGIRDSGVPLTVELVGSITGCYKKCLLGMQHTPGTHVPAELNRLVRYQFDDYISNFVNYAKIVKADDTSELADFGTYFDGYEE